MTIETPVLDRIDRRIIGILQTDGRISWRELADRVHLAPSSVADRVRRLEQTGVIRGYAASLDPRALGHDVRLMAPKFVIPYRKSGKNDSNDAEAICDAA